MKKRNEYRRAHTSDKVKIIRWINIALMIFMFGIVMYDSFVHNLPFYYILFIVAGVVVGHFVSKTQKLSVNNEHGIFTYELRPIGIIITIALLGVRFFVGETMLEKVSVVWTTDALYLFFAGIYYSKIRNVIMQIDEHVYSYFEDK